MLFYECLQDLNIHAYILVLMGRSASIPCGSSVLTTFEKQYVLGVCWNPIFITYVSPTSGYFLRLSIIGEKTASNIDLVSSKAELHSA